MKPNFKLSIIIPCFNNADTISAQLDALESQQWSEPWEIIVADNGSTDGTQEIIERYKQRLGNLRLIDASDRRGAGYARNQGVHAASADAIAFCDGDDIVHDGWVAAIGEALQHHDFVASKFETKSLNDEVRMVDWIEHSQHYGLQQYTYPPYLPHSGGCGLGVKRSVHEAVGGFDESMLRLQDTDYCWRIQLSGTELSFVPEAVVHVRHRTNPKAFYRQTREWAIYNVLLYKKYLPRGMPRLSLRRGINEWIDLLRKIPRLRREKARKAWLRKFHYRYGRLIGSIKYRVIAL